MNYEFDVTVERFERIAALPEGWTAASYRKLLKRLEFEGADSAADEELGAYAVMALQDFEPEEAARKTLEHALGDRMKPGLIQNLSEEMKVERQWELNPSMACHEPIFNAQVLLHEAFPEVYPAPDVARVSLVISANAPASAALLKKPIGEPFLARLLAHGLPDTAILNRLFDTALEKPPFPEASHIVWRHLTEPIGKGEDGSTRCRVSLYSPLHWIGDLEEVESFRSTAFADED